MSPDVRPYAPLSGSSIDKVSLVNGTLSVDIPVWSVKQRGNLSMGFHLTYHGGGASLTENCSIPQSQCLVSYVKSSPSVAVTPMFMVALTTGSYATYPNGAQTDYGIYWNVLTPDGGSHQMASIGNNQFRSVDATGWFLDQNTSVLTSKDGVHYVFTPISCDNGNTNHVVSCGWPSLLYVEDTNGNRITLTVDSNGRNTGWTDSLGRFVPFPLTYYALTSGGMSVPGVTSVSTSQCTGPLTATYAEQWQVPGYQGTTSFVFCYASVPIVTNHFPNPTKYQFETDADFTALQSVILPDGSQYTFQYTPLQNEGTNSQGQAINYGDLTQVTLPTGGTIDYTWFLDQQYCQLQANQSGGYPQNYIDVVTSRTLNANNGSASSTWNYGLGKEQVGTSTRSITTTETDPAGETTVHTLTGLLGTCSYYDTLSQYKDASGTLQRTDTTAYSAQPDFNSLPADNPSSSGNYQLAMGVVPTSVTTTWANGATKKTTYAYDGGAGFTATDITGTVTESGLPYGLVTSKVDTDYGAGAPGPTLLTTTTVYTESNSGYFALNILDHPTNITVTDANTGKQEITTHGYDESSLVSGNASGGTTPSTSGWNSSPPNGSVRGNSTNTSRYWDTAAGYLKTTRTYTDTGLIHSSTEPTNPLVSPASATTYSYSGTYDGAYLTGISDALGHATSIVYDEPSGLPTSETDPNNVTTTYGYDSSSRLTSVTKPGGDHNLASATIYTYPDPNHVERADLLNSSIGSETVTTTYDGLGREVQVHHVDPEGDEYQDTTYDLMGRKYTESTPYRSTTDPKYYGLTTTTYDLFGRTVEIQNPDQTFSTFQYAGASTLSTNESNGTTQSQKETRTDGLGRLIGVCEIVSSATPAQQGGQTPSACGMEITPTNNTAFTTNYVQSVNGPTSITQGPQTRSFSFDSLGHLTDSTNPETGHIHYVYDNDGNLITKQSPVAGDTEGSTETVSVSYGHDALHRVTSKSYSVSGSSPVTSITPSTTYSYDQSTAGGFTLENPVGRLTSESTTLNGTTQTESIYSYDTDGRVGSHHQCVLGGCSSLQDVEYHYDAAGNLTSLSTPQLNYTNTYNQAGHVKSVAPSWTTNANRPPSFFGPVSGQTQYAPNGEWLNVAYGNGATESYTYQPRWLTSMQVTGEIQTAPISGSSGTVTVSGSEQSKQVVTTPGTFATGSITITGTEGSHVICITQPHTVKCTAYPDTGSIVATVNGFKATGTYGAGATDSTVANSLAATLNASGSPVRATASGSVVTMTALASGAVGNYPYSVTNGADFSGTDSGSTMTGGVNAVMGTLYDSGTVTVTINGHAANASYGQSSSSSSLAAAIASATQSASAGGLTATASGSTVSLKSVAEGSTTNWPISISVSYNTANFSAASFSATGSGMSGGANATQSTGTLYSFGVQHAPDGQLKQSTDLINGTWNYTYDDFNRLLTANEVNSSNTVINGLSWDYDRYGNRWHQNLTAGTGTTHNLVFNAANQATTNLAYDNSGNVHTDSSHTYTYDAENRIEQVDGGISYIYDAEGRRVGKSNGTVYVVGLSGQVLDELDSGSWTRSEVYADGHHIATVTPSTVYFVHTDWLGTERVRTNMAGQVCQTTTSEPFGEDVVTSTPSGVTGCNPTPDFFTGKPRDTESNLDDFGARYFSSQWGRWMSPDWSASPTEVPYSTLANPQSLNLYAYVGNDPIVGEDPDGHFTFPFGDATNDGDNYNPAQLTAEQGKGDKPASKNATYDPKCDCYRVTDKLPLLKRIGKWFSNNGTALAGTATLSFEEGAIATLLAPEVIIPAATILGTAYLINHYYNKDGANTNPYDGPVAEPVIVVDPNGNAIPVKAGEQLSGSKDGKWVQVKDASGKPTGTRVDGGHPKTHSDPRAQGPHAHVPGTRNPDGTPWLPIN